MLESPVVLLFVCAVAAVYLLAACALVRAALRRAGWAEKASRGTLLAERAVLALAAVRGNWDVWYWGRQELFGGTGVRELNGGAVKVDVAGTSLWVAGAPYAATDKIKGALNVVPPGAFTILLYHTPDEILDVAATKRVDLYCAGHTHGGQVALPFYGALVTLSKFGKRYESGLYREGDTWLYVTRGIGMEGGPAP